MGDWVYFAAIYVVWFGSAIDAVRRPAAEFESRGFTKRRITGLLLIAGLLGAGPIGGLAYFIVVFPKLRRSP